MGQTLASQMQGSEDTDEDTDQEDKVAFKQETNSGAIKKPGSRLSRFSINWGTNSVDTNTHAETWLSRLGSFASRKSMSGSFEPCERVDPPAMDYANARELKSGFMWKLNGDA